MCLCFEGKLSLVCTYGLTEVFNLFAKVGTNSNQNILMNSRYYIKHVCSLCERGSLRFYSSEQNAKGKDVDEEKKHSDPKHFNIVRKC